MPVTVVLTVVFYCLNVGSYGVGVREGQLYPEKGRGIRTGNILGEAQNQTFNLTRHPMVQAV